MFIRNFGNLNFSVERQSVVVRLGERAQQDRAKLHKFTSICYAFVLCSVHFYNISNLKLAESYFHLWYLPTSVLEQATSSYV